MNADLHKIQNARLFKGLPERAFTRMISQIKVRSFLNAEIALDLLPGNEFASYIGYVVQGRILLVGEESYPLGLIIKDEFFLGRPFSMNDHIVKQLVSADAHTLIVFIPKEMMNFLASASKHVAQIIEDISDSILERAKVIEADRGGPTMVSQWLQTQDMSKTLSSWISRIEKKRLQTAARRRLDERNQNIMTFAWGVGLCAIVVVLIECMARRGNFSYSFSRSFNPSIVFDAFKAGSRFNIIIGIIGYSLILFTNLHSVLVWGIKKFSWKINYHLSSSFHMYFGIMGASFVVFHSAFNLTGTNIANFAVYAMVIGIASGIVGQFISNQIPKSILGEKIKLEGLKDEQAHLQHKAELLIDNQGLYRTSVALISMGVPTSFWGHLFSGPLLWFRGLRVKSALKNLGLSGHSAGAAAQLLVKEYQLRQKIKMLEISNIFFKKWMIIHRPIGYIVYTLATAHVIIETFF